MMTVATHQLRFAQFIGSGRICRNHTAGSERSPIFRRRMPFGNLHKRDGIRVFDRRYLHTLLFTNVTHVRFINDGGKLKFLRQLPRPNPTGFHLNEIC